MAVRRKIVLNFCTRYLLSLYLSVTWPSRIYNVFRMTPQSQLELQGNFLTHPFAEVVAEISHAHLTGSLRVSHKERKCVIYFKDGRVAFAVSNARASRLFETMLTRGRLDKNDLAQIPNFANDLEFADFLEEKAILTRAERDQIFIDQIEAILVDILVWTEGDWNFSSLARLRDGLVFEIDSDQMMVEYGRCLLADTILKRFRSLNEAFVRSSDPNLNLNLNSSELFVLSNFTDAEITAQEIVDATSALPEASTIQSLYVLWLGGLLERKNWNAAFTGSTVATMRRARIELKTEAKLHTTVIPETVAPVAEETAPAEHEVETPKIIEKPITLDEYLNRVEHAETLYDVLGIDPQAELADVKRAYFGLAKVFHPDHYHKDGAGVVRRVQSAFTELAKAHETLKTAEIREHYDFKIRKELADKETQNVAGTSDERSLQMKQAADSFERGFSLLMDSENEEALRFLARAAHFDPQNARYHAYYGKALSIDEKQWHKAEAEMQTALRLDPKSPTFRIMLAEFFIQMNLMKRAEGELGRMLALFPGNREAINLLASIQK